MNFFVGQKVKGVTEDKTSFEGVYRERLRESGKQGVVVSPSGVWIPADELFDLNPVGRNLREAAEDTVKALVDTFDPEQVKNMPDEDKDTITQVLVDQIGSDAKGNEDKVKEILNTELCKKELETSSDSDTEVVKKYQDKAEKDAEKDHLQESEGYGIFDNEDQFFEEYQDKTESGLTEDEFNSLLESLTKETYDRETLIDFIKDHKAISREEAEELLDNFLSDESVDALDQSLNVSEDDLDQEISDFLDQPEYENASLNQIYEGLLEHFNCSHLKESFLVNGEITKETFDQLEHKVQYDRKLKNSCSTKRFRESFEKHLTETLGSVENIVIAQPQEITNITNQTLEELFADKPVILSTEEGGIVENSDDLKTWSNEASTELCDDLLLNPEDEDYETTLNTVAQAFLDSLGVYYN